MQIKTCPVTVKTAGEPDGLEEGVFEALVAAYNVDSVNDRIIPGAFQESLHAWKMSGDPIPVLWSHNSDDPDYHIGYVEEAEERPEGLWVKGRIDLDEPKSLKIYKLLKGRRIRSFSFGYDILDARPGTKDDGSEVQELHRLGLHEISPCLYPANRATALLDVKAQPSATKTPDEAPPAKAGRVLSKANEDRVEQIARLAAELLASVKADQPTEVTAGASDSNAEKATPTPPAEAPAAAPEVAAKSDEPARPGTASARLRTDLELMELEVASYTI